MSQVKRVERSKILNEFPRLPSGIGVADPLDKVLKSRSAFLYVEHSLNCILFLALKQDWWWRRRSLLSRKRVCMDGLQKADVENGVYLVRVGKNEVVGMGRNLSINSKRTQAFMIEFGRRTVGAKVLAE